MKKVMQILLCSLSSSLIFADDDSSSNAARSTRTAATLEESPAVGILIPTDKDGKEIADQEKVFILTDANREFATADELVSTFQEKGQVAVKDLKDDSAGTSTNGRCCGRVFWGGGCGRGGCGGWGGGWGGGCGRGWGGGWGGCGRGGCWSGASWGGGWCGGGSCWNSGSCGTFGCSTGRCWAGGFRPVISSGCGQFAYSTGYGYNFPNRNFYYFPSANSYIAGEFCRTDARFGYRM